MLEHVKVISFGSNRRMRFVLLQPMQYLSYCMGSVVADTTEPISFVPIRLKVSTKSLFEYCLLLKIKNWKLKALQQNNF